VAKFYCHIGAACAAPVLVAVLAGQLNAQPKSNQPKTPIEAQNATASATGACAEIWSMKDHEDLDSDYRDFKHAMQEKLNEYAKGRAELKKNIDNLQDQLDGVRAMGIFSSAAQAETQEKAQGKGFLSKESAKAAGAALFDSSNVSQEAELVKKLEALRGEQAALQRRLIGWFAYGTIVNQCFEDQQKYLTDPKNKPNTASAPSTPTLGFGTIDAYQGEIAGMWHASCTYDKSTYPADGRFSMIFKGNSTLAAAFVDGAAASVNGAVKPDGSVTANGSVNMQGFNIRISMQGKLYRRNNGTIFGSGTFQSNDGADIKCKGTWNG
jgi:hypothetical protein